jgi:hypothetical protein
VNSIFQHGYLMNRKQQKQTCNSSLRLLLRMVTFRLLLEKIDLIFSNIKNYGNINYLIDTFFRNRDGSKFE